MSSVLGRIFSATTILKQPRGIQVRTSEIPDRVSSSKHATGARPQSPRGSAPTGFQEKLKEGFPEEEWKAFPRRKRKKASPSTASFRVRSLEFCCISSIAISRTYRDPCVTISEEYEDPSKIY